MKKIHLRFGSIVINFIMILLLFMLLYPLAMTFWCALKNEPGYTYTKWFPTIPLYLGNFVFALKHLWRYMVNTIFVGVVGTVGMLFIASISSYTFSRMNFPGKNIMYMMVIALMMIPGILTLVPSYMLYKEIVGLNNYLVLIVPIWAGGPIYGIFLLRCFFEGVPEDIFEAARIDGAGEFRLYSSICLPLSIPILSTLAIMQISGTWNDYIWPMITINDDELYTISAGLLMNYIGGYTSNYVNMFAGYLVAAIPLFFLFVFANKYYVEGLTSSGMKL